MCRFLMFLVMLLSVNLYPDQELYIFYHCCTRGNWEKIIPEQLLKLKNSTLFSKVRKIYIGNLGEINVLKLYGEDPKMELLFYHKNCGLMEKPTLKALRKMAQQKPDAYFLYFHSKGITTWEGSFPNIQDCRYFLEYFMIEKWEKCVEALNEGFDVVGVNYTNDPRDHFSGNFWWAKGSYLASLPDLKKGYYESEFWLFRNKPRYKCLFKSGVHHYYQPFPKERYCEELL